MITVDLVSKLARLESLFRTEFIFIGLLPLNLIRNLADCCLLSSFTPFCFNSLFLV